MSRKAQAAQTVLSLNPQTRPFAWLVPLVVPVLAALGTGAAAVVLLLVLVVTGGFDTGSDETAGGGSLACGDVEVTDLDAAQAQNAAIVVDVAQELGLDEGAMVTALAVGLTESRLRNLANPAHPESMDLPHDGVGSDHDSVNVFQQRPSQGWGSVAELMDPAYAARAFFGGPDGPNNSRGWPDGLLDFPGWEDLSVVDAADQVQVSAFPQRVGDQVPAARAILSQVADITCEPVPGGGGLGEGSWSHPVPDFSIYWGNYGAQRLGYDHAGEDLAAPTGTPILAVTDGVVAHVSCTSWLGRSPCQVVVDHGDDEQGQNVQSVYVHMWPTGVDVHEGQSVVAGQPIGSVGSNGNSTGAHLHFEIWIGGHGQNVDPTPFMATHGIALSERHAAPVSDPG